jgi:cytochrome c oxidase cbb3-type subunit I/II
MTFVTVAVLHIFNSLSLPVSGMKSYSVLGVQDAWYNGGTVIMRLHFLDYTFLRIDVLFLFQNRPVYSYRLSIVHFWSLIFIYIWAGPPFIIFCFA